MNCSQVKDQLHPFADGELSPEEMEAVQAALADCPDAQLELKELEATSLFAREAFNGPVADVDLSGVFDGVMARIAAEDAAEEAVATPAKAETPGLWQRFTEWFNDLIRFEQPMQSLATFAALALVVGGLYYAVGTGGSGDPGVTPGGNGPSMVAGTKDGSDTKKKTTPRRRGMENEQEMARSNGATVESYEVAEGQLVIEGGEDDAPVVVWHVDEDGAVIDNPEQQNDKAVPTPLPVK